VSERKVSTLVGAHDDTAALESDATWFWLLDDSVEPQPEALERLLELLDRWDGLPSPALLASKVVGPDGSPDPAAFPVPRVVDDQDLVVAAFERNVFPIRIARAGSLLVSRRAVTAFGLPAPGRDLDWTARVLKDGLGLLVPDSVVTRPPADAGLELGGRLRLLLGSSLRPGEKPLFAFRLAEALLDRLRRRG
jgi:GT2 family glycosyltransferase